MRKKGEPRFFLWNSISLIEVGHARAEDVCPRQAARQTDGLLLLGLILKREGGLLVSFNKAAGNYLERAAKEIVPQLERLPHSIFTEQEISVLVSSTKRGKG